MKIYTIWIKHQLSTSDKPSPNRIQAHSPEAAERIFWAKIKPKDRHLIQIVKVEETA